MNGLCNQVKDIVINRSDIPQKEMTDRYVKALEDCQQKYLNIIDGLLINLIDASRFAEKLSAWEFKTVTDSK